MNSYRSYVKIEPKILYTKAKYALSLNLVLLASINFLLKRIIKSDLINKVYSRMKSSKEK